LYSSVDNIPTSKPKTDKIGLNAKGTTQTFEMRGEKKKIMSIFEGLEEL
jgi:hypothetical protein